MSAFRFTFDVALGVGLASFSSAAIQFAVNYSHAQGATP